MRVQASTQIAAPIEAVWEIASDPERALSFMSGITRWEVVSDLATGLGARYRMLLRVGSAEVGGLIEIVEWDDPCDFAWTSVTGIDQRGRFRLRTAAPGKTRVELRLAYGVAGAGLSGWLAERIAAPIVRGHLGRTLHQLKRLVEYEQMREHAAQTLRAHRTPWSVLPAARPVAPAGSACSKPASWLVPRLVPAGFQSSGAFIALEHAGDRADQLLYRHCGRVKDSGIPPKAEDNHSIGDPQSRRQVVGHQQDRNPPFVSRLPHRVEHVRGLANTERRRWFVEDQQPAAPGQRASDGNGLLLTARELEHARLGQIVTHPQAQQPQVLGAVDEHPFLVDEPQPAEQARPQELATEEEVRGNVEVRSQRQVLVDRLDAMRVRILGAAQLNGVPVDANLAGIRRFDP